MYVYCAKLCHFRPFTSCLSQLPEDISSAVATPDLHASIWCPCSDTVIFDPVIDHFYFYLLTLLFSVL